MPLNPARTARDDRRRAILDVARDIFMQEGYAAASMSAIAAQVGGSKGTLYNYFPSKEALFAALMDAECGSEIWFNQPIRSGAKDLAGALTEIGRGFLDFLLTDKVQNIHRLVIAESGRFPELGLTFYESGPRRSVERVGAWMAAEIGAGRLRRADPERLATLFLELCKTELHQKMMWNVIPEPSDASKHRNVAEAVQVFLAAYGEAADDRGRR